MKVLKQVRRVWTLAPLGAFALVLFIFLASCGIVPTFDDDDSTENTGSSSGTTLDVGALPDKAKPYIKWVMYAAKKYGTKCPEVTPQLLAAQIMQESGWDPGVSSSANAQGIAQFIPSTWESFKMDVSNKNNEDKPDGIYDVWTPGDAIVAMARYDCALVSGDIKNMLEYKWTATCKHPRTKQRVGPPTPSSPMRGTKQELMLAAYNSGSCNVSASRGVSDIAETQNYVKSIMALKATYEKVVAEYVNLDVAHVISLAEQQVGKPYVYGAPEGDTTKFDCSSLMQYVYKKGAGIQLPRTSQRQAAAGRVIPKGQKIEPGDLLVYSFESANDHIGIYAGNSIMIHARNSKYGVVKVNVSDSSTGYDTMGKAYQFAVRLMEKSTGQNVGNKNAPAESGSYRKPSDFAVGTPYHKNGPMWSKGYHTGVDFLSPSGNPVYAVGDGEVVSAGKVNSYGNEVIIRHMDGGRKVYSQYAHMQDGSLKVRAGQLVKAGTVIGISGATGNVDGAHLHFEIRNDPGRFGNDIDPIAWLRRKGVKI